MSPAELLTVWRDRARELAPYSAPAAAAFTRAAEELEASLQAMDGEALTLDQAAAESGLSKDHLRHLVARGRIPNAGRPRAPRIARRDLPRRPGHARPGPGQYDPDADALRLVSRPRSA